MKLTFHLRYRTRFGQSLFITGNHELLGDGQFEKAVPLQYLDGESWRLELELDDSRLPDPLITYNYILRNEDGSLIYDWGGDKSINPAAFGHGEVLIIDSWNDAGFFENAFYTEPFKQVLLKANGTGVRRASRSTATHTFKVKAPLLAKSQTLCLLGEFAALENWNTARPLLLSRIAGEDFFSVDLDLRLQSLPVAYKYGVYDVKRNAFVRYEDGQNRILRDTIVPDKRTIVNDGFAVLPSDTWKGAGVAIPVFSLRSEKSFGVGEFADLKLLADWAAKTGLKLIQILPINDTTATHTWTDSYPYAAISAFALHPIYLNLEHVASAKNKRLLKTLEAERKRLNALDSLDYEAVLKAKLDFVRQVYPSQKSATFKCRDYQQFFKRNAHWLVPYAAFCHLRDKFGTCDFNRWPTHSKFCREEIETLAAKDSPVFDEIAINYFIQYHLHVQLKEATEHAHEKGVIIKGDIAIGVYRFGADAWQQPELFHMDVQAGAPPDMFGVKGQNWGFPTYNWLRMKEDGFAWWKQRFEQMGDYFDAFRIDHILGFFRIWSIPMHAVEGILGYFVPAMPVKAWEFENRGVPFDRKRFTQPWITDAVLQEIFSAESETVKREFLDEGRPGNYSLKPQFATQRQVERHFASLKLTERDTRIREGLYDLISNVILLETEGPGDREYHFRFSMENTPSFRAFDAHAQSVIKELYVDYFFRRQDDFWMKEAMQKLPALKRVTNMLVCGEDLGLVPHCVPEVMKQLGLLSLEIQRMPKRLGAEFSRPADAPYLSVVTPGTHDMSTIRGWWEEDKKLSQKFYNQELQLPGVALEDCGPDIVKAIVRQHLSSPAMWSIFQLQDLLGMSGKLRRSDTAAERINIPAISNYYWRYRMHLTLEKLLEAGDFNRQLQTMVTQSGR